MIDHVIESRDYSSLAELSRHTTIPYQTLWAWHKGTRNLKRPPAAPVLLRFAEDMGLPAEVVFRAGGRAWQGQEAPDAGELEIAHLWRQLSPAQRRMTERLIRDLLTGEQQGPNRSATNS